MGVESKRSFLMSDERSDTSSGTNGVYNRVFVIALSTLVLAIIAFSISLTFWILDDTETSEKLGHVSTDKLSTSTVIELKKNGVLKYKIGNYFDMFAVYSSGGIVLGSFSAGYYNGLLTKIDGIAFTNNDWARLRTKI